MSENGPVVGLVTSAGGLEALSRVLGPLPATFAAPIVALQHQPPDRTNLLAAILARRTSLEVRVAIDGQVLCDGVVHVAPAGWHTLVRADRTILLVPSGELPPCRPSGDLFLTSLALAVGNAAIAVVLSGAGHDGAIGAAAVHACAGTVIVSDEASSEHFAMPSATIRLHVADHVAPLDDIPELLERSSLTSGMNTPGTCARPNRRT